MQSVRVASVLMTSSAPPATKAAGAHDTEATSYLPWPCVQLALTTQQNHIDAVTASFPAEPVLVQTPLLLHLLSGRAWPKFMVSTQLFRIYLAVLFHVRSDTRWTDAPPFTAITDALRRDQARAYREFGDRRDDDAPNRAFTFAYLRSYETALVKVMHCFRAPVQGTTTPRAPSQAVLDMSGRAAEQLEPLFTASSVLPADDTASEAFLSELDAERTALQATRVMCEHPATRKHVRANDPCPCGSGRKYKKCHRTDDMAAVATERQEADEASAAFARMVLGASSADDVVAADDRAVVDDERLAAQE